MAIENDDNDHAVRVQIEHMMDGLMEEEFEALNEPDSDLEDAMNVDHEPPAVAAEVNPWYLTLFTADQVGGGKEEWGAVLVLPKGDANIWQTSFLPMGYFNSYARGGSGRKEEIVAAQ